MAQWDRPAMSSAREKWVLQRSSVLRCQPGVPELGFTEDVFVVRRSCQGMSTAKA